MTPVYSDVRIDLAIARTFHEVPKDTGARNEERPRENGLGLGYSRHPGNGGIESP
jgi:hypothetical protein